MGTKLKKSLKTELKSGSLSVGGWIMIGHPVVGEIMSRAGFDWVAVDLEHTTIDLQSAESLIRAVVGCETPCLIRLTNNDPNLIKRVMDAGATGIIVPMVETSDQARIAVESMQYPPSGKRGVGLARAQRYGSPSGLVGYCRWLEEEAVCIVQLEHINAIDNCREILSVDGVDGYMLGPYDLSASMGLIGELDHPDVLEAIDRVRQTAISLGKPGGIHVVEPDPQRLQEAVDSGFNFIAYSVDTRMIDTACRMGLAAVKNR